MVGAQGKGQSDQTALILGAAGQPSVVLGHPDPISPQSRQLDPAIPFYRPNCYYNY